jgi:hypothetical protein
MSADAFLCPKDAAEALVRYWLVLPVFALAFTSLALIVRTPRLCFRHGELAVGRRGLVMGRADAWYAERSCAASSFRRRPALAAAHRIGSERRAVGGRCRWRRRSRGVGVCAEGGQTGSEGRPPALRLAAAAARSRPPPLVVAPGRRPCAAGPTRRRAPAWPKASDTCVDQPASVAGGRQPVPGRALRSLNGARGGHGYACARYTCFDGVRACLDDGTACLGEALTWPQRLPHLLSNPRSRLSDAAPTLVLPALASARLALPGGGSRLS